MTVLNVLNANWMEQAIVEYFGYDPKELLISEQEEREVYDMIEAEAEAVEAWQEYIDAIE